MNKAEMIRKMTAAGIDLETALDIALGGESPEVQTEPEPAENPKAHTEPEVPATPEVKPAGISQEMGAQLLAAITKLTGAVQRSNVMTIGSDDDGESQQDKVDKMLTRFLTGEKPKNKED